MKRYTGQKALYEAIARTRAKSQRRGILEMLHPSNGKHESIEVAAVEEPKPPQVVRVEPASRIEPVKPPEEKPVVEKLPPPMIKPVRPVVEEPRPQPRMAQPWLRPKAVQLHDGRIEISLPYALGVTILLVAVLLMLGAFRLGQTQRRVQLPAMKSSAPSPTKPSVTKADQSPPRQETPAPVVREPVAPPSTDTDGSTAPAATAGDHVIVLAQNAQSKPLEAATAYFKEQGVDTVVIEVDKLRDYLAGAGLNTNVLGTRRGYMLVTRNYYDNPENPGTEGFKEKQRIIQIGKGYKAKAGSESFAPKYFSDAYGMKIR